MLPFTLELQPGESAYLQVVYAVKRALAAGHLRPGDPFPSVRRLSQELRINPNTAHRVVAALTGEGLLEVRPGIGTTVAEAPRSRAAERRELLAAPLERLVVEAKHLNLELSDVTDALREHWNRLSPRRGATTRATASTLGRARRGVDASESEEKP